MDEPIEAYYQRQAQEYIDTLYDKGYFSAEVTRQDMRGVEELLAFMFQSQVKSAVKASEMLRKIRERKES